MATSETSTNSLAERAFEEMKARRVPDSGDSSDYDDEEALFPDHGQLSEAEIEEELAKWDEIECTNEFMRDWVKQRKAGIRAGDRPWTQDEVSEYIRKVRS